MNRKLKLLDCFTDGAICSSVIFGGLDLLDGKELPEFFIFWMILLGGIRLVLFVFNKDYERIRI